MFRPSFTPGFNRASAEDVRELLSSTNFKELAKAVAHISDAVKAQLTPELQQLLQRIDNEVNALEAAPIRAKL